MRLEVGMHRLVTHKQQGIRLYLGPKSLGTLTTYCDLLQWLAVCQYFIYCPLKQGIAVSACVNSRRWVQILEVLLRVSIITYQ